MLLFEPPRHCCLASPVLCELGSFLRAFVWPCLITRILYRFFRQGGGAALGGAALGGLGKMGGAALGGLGKMDGLAGGLAGKGMSKGLATFRKAGMAAKLA